MLPTWLDTATNALLADVVATLRHWNAGRALAIILYGSVARHEERPLDDPEPSDVDVLIVLNTDDQATISAWGIFSVLGDAYRRHLDAPREVNILFMFATRELREWDETFIANVARDGILLSGEPPVQLTPKHAEAV